MKKSTTLAPVERDEKGRVKGGALNPGGMTAEQKEARAVLQLWLESEGTAERGKAAYLKALDDGNAAIIKDWADRTLGKVKERVEHSSDPDAPVLTGWTLQDVLEALAAAREAKK